MVTSDTDRFPHLDRHGVSRHSPTESEEVGERGTWKLTASHISPSGKARKVRCDGVKPTCKACLRTAQHTGITDPSPCRYFGGRVEKRRQASQAPATEAGATEAPSTEESPSATEPPAPKQSTSATESATELSRLAVSKPDGAPDSLQDDPGAFG